MIPYIHVPDLKIGPLTLHPFGLLVATGVIIGTWLATKRAKQRGLDLDKLNSFITWMLVAGFLGGHMLDQIFYHPQEVLKRPWSIFLLWEGLSSFGGFVGGLIGVILWKFFEAVPVYRTPFFTLSKFRRRQKTMPIMPFCDLILSVFPVAWIFGRSGCSVVHDHQGMKAPAGHFLAVAFGTPDPTRTIHLGSVELRYGNAPHFDLGLLEMMFTVILATMLALTWRKKLITGSYIAAVALSYAPVRFAMDFLRVRDMENADPRYGQLTPAQWSCVALFLFGLYMVKVCIDLKKSGYDPMELVSMSARYALPAGGDVPIEPIDPPVSEEERSSASSEAKEEESAATETAADEGDKSDDEPAKNGDEKSPVAKSDAKDVEDDKSETKPYRLNPLSEGKLTLCHRERRYSRGNRGGDDQRTTASRASKREGLASRHRCGRQSRRCGATPS